MSAIVKLYDKHLNNFKLNEQISFIGVLEFKAQEKPQNDSDQIDSSQIKTDDNTELDPNTMTKEFFSGIPNEGKIP